jgi:CBS domain-containing protein
VLDDGRLVGMVSIGDLVKVRMVEIEQEAASLREFVTAS